MDECARLEFNIAAQDIVLIEGVAGSGKSSALIDRAKNLIANGESPASVLIVTGTQLAAKALSSQLSGAMTDLQDMPIVTTCDDLESAVLASELGFREVGRHFRIIHGIDKKILDQDLETTGIPLYKIEHAKRQIQKGWAAGDLAKYVNDDDIRTVKRELDLCLEDVDSMMENEDHYLAASIMVEQPQFEMRTSIKHVLIDDFHLLCRASQIFVTSWAQETLMVTSDGWTMDLSASEDGYERGIRELARECRVPVQERNRSHRSRTVIEILNKTEDYCEAEHEQSITSYQDSKEGSFEVVCHDSPSEEILSIARMTADLHESKSSKSRIAVTATDRIWLINMKRALDRMGSEYIDMTDLAASCDDELPLGEALLQDIASDPSDGLLWRRWCASEDALANSAYFANLRHRKERPPLFEALLNNIYSDDKRNLSALESKHKDSVQILVSQAKRAIAAQTDSGNSVPACKAFQNLPKQPTDHIAFAEGIIICPIDLLVGLNPDVVIILGAANGSFLPKEYFDLSKMEEPERRNCRNKASTLLYRSVGKSNDKVIVSYCGYAKLAEAQALGLKIDKIEYRNGERMARMSLDEAVSLSLSSNS